MRIVKSLKLSKTSEYLSENQIGLTIGKIGSDRIGFTEVVPIPFHHFSEKSEIRNLEVGTTIIHSKFGKYRIGNRKNRKIGRNLHPYTFYNFSIGQNPDRVYVIALCRGDVALHICASCLRDANTKLTELCPIEKQSIGWYDRCMLRYWDQPIFNIWQTLPNAYTYNLNTVSNAITDQFNQAVKTLVHPDLSRQNCSDCLNRTRVVLPECCSGKIGGRVLYPSCNFRYETGIFYGETPNETPNDGRPPTTNPTLPPPPPDTASMEISTVESLQFDFDTIRVATNEFSGANKLGEGGFGVVYKGRLSNGRDMAVKRLSKTSSQGDVEFKNEVLLMANLQHRNLIQKSVDIWMGVCVTKSLDIWMGLLYLHEDSRVRIIHRDLKASNILLDAEMNPKIADFGMARIFGLEETQASTRNIVGTYGYMAPEYAMFGQFSVKSDVYSFGVLVLEIISGHKNSQSFGNEDSIEYLVSHAWKNWKEGTHSKFIDPTILDEKVVDRPTMASIVNMLSSVSYTLKLPSEPAFLRCPAVIAAKQEYSILSAECIIEGLTLIFQIYGGVSRPKRARQSNISSIKMYYLFPSLTLYSTQPYINNTTKRATKKKN
ncbi:hypothetical protein AQUCO_00100392v1 [Aquilegia coerulea]|uniref:non-specific serine/threonine protein kinase n=1 Tax=Aquilegia coerulea TaxID=218851 RepID=A0A2G5FA30_AQUCA|nr:hypothetical protein AQUCO_00100392v1 [Aquilegia coerulea]